MNNETRASESVTSGSRGPSRRTLVRTAAWSVPVISTVAAAPAFAAASDVFNVSSSATLDNGRNYIDVTITIANPAGGQLSASGVVVSVTTITAASGTQPTVASASSPTGWTVSDPLPLSYGVTYQSTIANGASTSVTIRFTFGTDKPDNKVAVTVSGTVSVSGFNPNQKGFSAVAPG